MEKIRVGLVGCSRGRSLVGVFGAHPKAEVTALCDLEADKLPELGQAFRLPDAALYTDYEKFLAAPLDAVIKILRSQVAARPHMVWYSLYGTKGHLENGRLNSPDGLVHVEGKMDKHHFTPTSCTIVDPKAPAEAKKGGHGTSEYYMIRDFLRAAETGSRPPIDVIKATDMTIPGIIAHQSAMKGGVWLDVPLMNW